MTNTWTDGQTKLISFAKAKLKIEKTTVENWFSYKGKIFFRKNESRIGSD